MVVAVWPNGLRTRPTLSSLWKEYSGKPAVDHFGLDMYGFKYNHSIAAGIVTKIGYNSFGGGGHEVYLKLDNGDVILYYHNAQNLLVKPGERVEAGWRLGVQSNSGKTYGIHLHLEVWRNGYRSRRVDPLPYITKLVGTSPASSAPIKIEGNPVKIIYKTTTQPGGLPLWALADDEAVDPASAGFVETRDTNVVSGQWAPRYGTFVFKSTADYVALRTQYRAPRTNTPGGGTLVVTDEQVADIARRIGNLLKAPTAGEVAKAVVAELKLPGN
jgi:hypothetical protein